MVFPNFNEFFTLTEKYSKF